MKNPETLIDWSEQVPALALSIGLEEVFQVLEPYDFWSSECYQMVVGERGVYGVGVQGQI